MHRDHLHETRASRRRTAGALTVTIGALTAAAIAAGAAPALAAPAGSATAPVAAASVAAAPAGAPTHTLAAEAAAAQSRLGTDLAAPHAGTPEAITHPASDTMSSPTSTGTGTTNGALAPAITATTNSGVYGADVSSYQTSEPWSTMYGAGLRFVYIKATEGTYYTSPAFGSQYDNSYAAGFIRGAYAFAIPDNSSGAAQADYFVAHGGGWSPDGRTLPGVLDIEYNPYGAECYGLSKSQLVNWVASFDNEYQRLTGRPPMIYTNANFWNTCTGGSSVGSNSPLIVALYGSSPYPLPGGWSVETIWQYTDSIKYGGDGDWFNGAFSQLRALALGGASAPTPPPPAPSGTDQLGVNQVLTGGQSVSSTSGAYQLRMQGDGNLVLYTSSGHAMWASNTAGHAGSFAVMQSDGNLVVYSPAHRALWSSRTSGAGASHAIVQNDGNFVIYRNTGGATWASGT